LDGVFVEAYAQGAIKSGGNIGIEDARVIRNYPLG
jgi:hypothetical protein